MNVRQVCVCVCIFVCVDIYVYVCIHICVCVNVYVCKCITVASLARTTLCVWAGAEEVTPTSTDQQASSSTGEKK